MGKRKDDDDEPTPTQRAVRMGLWAGGIGIALMCLLDAGKMIAGGHATLTGKVGLIIGAILIVLVIWRVKRSK